MRRASQTREAARTSISGNWGLAIGVYVIVMLISSVSYGMSSVSYISVIAVAINIFLVPPIVLGYVRFTINLIRRQNPKFGNLFTYFQEEKASYWTSVGLYWLKVLFTFLWALLFIIPGIIKAYSYAMSDYLVVNKISTSANEAITLSKKLMNGNKWRLFCLHFSFIGWMLLVPFTLGILLIWLGPYMTSAEMIFYEEIAEREGLIASGSQPTAVGAGESGSKRSVCEYCGANVDEDNVCIGCGKKY